MIMVKVVPRTDSLALWMRSACVRTSSIWSNRHNRWCRCSRISGIPSGMTLRHSTHGRLGFRSWRLEAEKPCPVTGLLLIPCRMQLPPANSNVKHSAAAVHADSQPGRETLTAWTASSTGVIDSSAEISGSDYPITSVRTSGPRTRHLLENGLYRLHDDGLCLGTIVSASRHGQRDTSSRRRRRRQCRRRRHSRSASRFPGEK